MVYVSTLSRWACVHSVTSLDSTVFHREVEQLCISYQKPCKCRARGPCRQENRVLCSVSRENGVGRVSPQAIDQHHLING